MICNARNHGGLIRDVSLFQCVYKQTERRCLLFHTANEENAYNLIHASNLTHIADDICNALQNTIIAVQAQISHVDE